MNKADQGRWLAGKLWMLLLLPWLVGGCVLLPGSGYDKQPLTIQTLNLFNQRIPSSMARKNWKGDWLFRRDRIELVDAELRSSKPDILMLQGAMERDGSASESDVRILARGALEGYAWDTKEVATWRDTGELENMAVAVGLPVRVVSVGSASTSIRRFGGNGQVVFSELSLDQTPVLIFNVRMPDGAVRPEAFRSLAKFIRQKVREKASCLKRVIVGGTMPSSMTVDSTRVMVSSLQLRDVSDGYCEVESDCFTGSPINEIFMVTQGDASPSRMDRIYIHQSGKVLSSAAVFNTPRTINRYASTYGISRLWPSRRFGWGGTIRLASCTEEDREQMRGTSP